MPFCFYAIVLRDEPAIGEPQFTQALTTALPVALTKEFTVAIHSFCHKVIITCPKKNDARSRIRELRRDLEASLEGKRKTWLWIQAGPSKSNHQTARSKSSVFSKVADSVITSIENRLNNRPRKLLQYRTPFGGFYGDSNLLPSFALCT